jgi:hypothetical protein
VVYHHAAALCLQLPLLQQQLHHQAMWQRQLLLLRAQARPAVVVQQ